MPSYRVYPKPIKLGTFSSTDGHSSFISIERASRALGRSKKEFLQLGIDGALRLSVRTKYVRFYPHNWETLSESIKEALELLNGPKGHFVISLVEFQLEELLASNTQYIRGGERMIKISEDTNSIKYQVIPVVFFDETEITIDDIGVIAEDLSVYLDKENCKGLPQEIIIKEPQDRSTDSVRSTVNVDWTKVTINVFPKLIVCQYGRKIIRQDIYGSGLFGANRQIKKLGTIFYNMIESNFPSTTDKQEITRLRKTVKGWLNAKNDPFTLMWSNKKEKFYKPRFKLRKRRDDDRERWGATHRLFEDDCHIPTEAFDHEEGDEAAKWLEEND